MKAYGNKALLAALGALFVLMISACGGGGGATAPSVTQGASVGSGGTVSPPAATCTDPNASNQNGALPCVCKAGFETGTDGLCKATVLRYTDKVLASYTFGYPFLVNKTGLTRVVNQEKQDDNVGSCAFPSDGAVFAIGTIPALCKWFTDPSAQYGRWIVYAVNPFTATMAAYKGDLPAKLAFTPLDNGGVETTGSVWRFVQEPERDFPAGVAQVARVVDGAYFVPGNATNTLYFRALDGNTTSVHLGTTADGSFKIIQTFSN